MNSSCLNYGYGEEKERERETKSLFSSPQESLTKIKACLVDNKKHIRFGEWNSNDVSSNICRLLLSRTWFFWSPHVQNQNLQQRLRTTPISIMSTNKLLLWCFRLKCWTNISSSLRSRWSTWSTSPKRTSSGRRTSGERANLSCKFFWRRKLCSKCPKFVNSSPLYKYPGMATWPSFTARI